MNTIRRLVWLIGLSACLVTACGGGDGDTEPVQVPFTVIDTANSGITTPRFVAVKDGAAWASLWAEHKSRISPQPALPPVDFDQQMVVAVFVGQRPSGSCDSVAIQSVKQTATRLTVEYRESDPPPPGVNCTGNIAFPAQLVATAKSALPIEFVAAN